MRPQESRRGHARGNQSSHILRRRYTPINALERSTEERTPFPPKKKKHFKCPPVKYLCVPSSFVPPKKGFTTAVKTPLKTRAFHLPSSNDISTVFNLDFPGAIPPQCTLTLQCAPSLFSYRGHGSKFTTRSLKFKSYSLIGLHVHVRIPMSTRYMCLWHDNAEAEAP